MEQWRSYMSKDVLRVVYYDQSILPGMTVLPGQRLRANLVWKSQASLSRYSSDITTTILLHLHTWTHKHQLFAQLEGRMATSADIPPLLDEFTCDGPNAGTWEDISVKHTQLQLVIRLLQLSDHLTDKVEVVLAVADEGVKHLRWPWIQHKCTSFMKK